MENTTQDKTVVDSKPEQTTDTIENATAATELAVDSSQATIEQITEGVKNDTENPTNTSEEVHGLTTPKNKGSEGQSDDDSKDQNDKYYYNDESEGDDPEGDDDLGSDDMGDMDGDDEFDQDDNEPSNSANPIDQLKKVLMNMKSGGKHESSYASDDDNDSNDIELEKQKTPKKKKDSAFFKQTYKEDEERLFTPLCEIIDPSIFDESDSSEDEGLPDYRIGGYHPVHVGEIFCERYIIVQKLGWGHFSTVWLTKDLKFDTFVALKIQKSAQNYLEAAYDEIEILDVCSKRWKLDEWDKTIQHITKKLPEGSKVQVTSDDCYCVQLNNSFLHYGPNGKHFVMVFEVMGVNLLEIIKRYDYKGVPIPLVRKMAKQCLLGLDYLHRMCGIIHTDLKPENVLVCLTPDEVKQISTENRLSQKKDIKKHLKQDRNIAEMALGKAFKPNPNGGMPLRTNVRKPNRQPTEGEKDYQHVNGFVPITYAEMIPEYTEANKSRKKKLRKKHQEELDAINSQRFDEWKASQETPNFYGKSEDQELAKDVNEPDAEVIDQNTAKEAELLKDEGVEKSEGKTDDKAEAKEKEEPVIAGGNKIDEDVKIKICDLGNGCWRHHHFSSAIQTRQYRSPETIIGLTYGTSADIWSFACMMFEMITGDFLFEPRKGHNFDKDDDHLAQMMEILGKMPKNLAFSGRLSKRFFDKTGHLLKIRGLQHWPLKKVLMEKYRFVESEAESLADFLLPMLEWYPEKRATAQDMLDHPWLNMESNYEYSLNERDYQVMMLKSKLSQEPLVEDNKEMSELGESDNDLFNADYENNDSTIDDEDESDDDEFFTVSNAKTIDKKHHFSEDEDIETRLPGPNYLNNSFTGPYPEDMSRPYVDKGPNPQFIDLDDE